MLLICKQTRGDHYSFKEGLKIQDYKVQDVTSRRLSRDARWAYSFMLVHKDNVHAYTLLARTEDEKNKWIEAINEAYDNDVPAQSVTSTHLPVMTTFDKPTSCHYCHKLLKGLYYQGYQCAVCRKICSSDVCLTGMRCCWCGMTAHSSCLSSFTEEMQVCTFGVLQPIFLPRRLFPSPELRSHKSTSSASRQKRAFIYTGN